MSKYFFVCLYLFIGQANATIINFNDFNAGDGLTQVNAVTTPLGAIFSASSLGPFQIVDNGLINVARAFTNPPEADILVNFSFDVDFVRVVYTDNLVVSLTLYDQVQTVSGLQASDLINSVFDTGATTLELFNSGIRAAQIEANGTFVNIASIEFGQISSVPVPATVWLFGLGLAGFGFSRKKKKA